MSVVSISPAGSLVAVGSPAASVDWEVGVDCGAVAVADGWEVGEATAVAAAGASVSGGAAQAARIELVTNMLPVTEKISLRLRAGINALPGSLRRTLRPDISERDS